MCGEDICLGDVMIAPYFDRMCVLEYYTGFVVPDTMKYEKWHR